MKFLSWANAETGEPALVKAGLAHLWLVTLHPFDDGNGRIARAVGDLFLARSDGSPRRFYSLSAQIQRERKDYYDALERTQKGTLDVTDWLSWFLGTLARAVVSAQIALDAVLVKSRVHRQTPGMTGKLEFTSSDVRRHRICSVDGECLAARLALAEADCSAWTPVPKPDHNNDGRTLAPDRASNEDGHTEPALVAGRGRHFSATGLHGESQAPLVGAARTRRLRGASGRA